MDILQPPFNPLFLIFSHPMHFRHPVSEWRRLIGRLRSQVIFCKRATNYRALLQKMTYKDKASYYSSPSCIRVVFIIFAYAYESLITHPLMRYPNLSLICPSKVIGMIFAYAHESCIAHSLIQPPNASPCPVKYRDVVCGCVCVCVGVCVSMRVCPCVCVRVRVRVRVRVYVLRTHVNH